MGDVTCTANTTTSAFATASSRVAHGATGTWNVCASASARASVREVTVARTPATGS